MGGAEFWTRVYYVFYVIPIYGLLVLSVSTRGQFPYLGFSNGIPREPLMPAGILAQVTTASSVVRERERPLRSDSQ